MMDKGLTATKKPKKTIFRNFVIELLFREPLLLLLLHTIYNNNNNNNNIYIYTYERKTD